MKKFNQTLLYYEDIIYDYYNFFYSIKRAYKCDRFPEKLCYHSYRTRLFVNKENYNFMNKVLQLESGYEIVYKFLTECCKIKHSLLLDMIASYPKYLELKLKIEKVLTLEDIIKVTEINEVIDKHDIEEINKDIEYIYKKYFYLQSTADKIIDVFKRYRNNELDNSYYNIIEFKDIEINVSFNKEILQKIFNILSYFCKFLEEVNLFFNSGDEYKYTVNNSNDIYKKLYVSDDYSTVYMTKNDIIFKFLNKLLINKYGITDKVLIDLKNAIIYSYNCKYKLMNYKIGINNYTDDEYLSVIAEIEDDDDSKNDFFLNLKNTYLIFCYLKDKLKPILDNWDKIESEALSIKIS